LLRKKPCWLRLHTFAGTIGSLQGQKYLQIFSNSSILSEQ